MYSADSLALCFHVLPQFFNQVLVMGKSSVSDLSEHVFDLIQELFAIDPMLLTSVMPQLEFKLKVNTVQHSKKQQQYLISNQHKPYSYIIFPSDFILVSLSNIDF